MLLLNNFDVPFFASISESVTNVYLPRDDASFVLKVVPLSFCYIHHICQSDTKREHIFKHFYIDNSSTTFFPIFPVQMLLSHPEAEGIMGCTLNKVLSTD